MRFERLERLGRVVLAADGEQDAAMPEIEHGALERLECSSRIFRTEPDAGQAVFTDHAAPERVVQIDDERFGHTAREWIDEAKPFASEIEEVWSGDRQPNGQPLPLVAPGFAPVAGHEAVVI